MPNTIVALIILVFAVLPGVPAYLIYKTMNGFDWRKTEWEKTTIIVCFSLFGLILYTVVASITKLPEPVYVIPKTFSPETFSPSILLPISISLLGHFVASLLLSLVMVYIVRWVSKHTKTSGLPSAWDYFISSSSPKHWVVIKCINGDSFAGIIEYADCSVGREDRDVILREPSKYNMETKNYLVLNYQQLFLPSTLISSIATIYDSSLDKRLREVGTNLFSSEGANERKSKNNPT